MRQDVEAFAVEHQPGHDALEGVCLEDDLHLRHRMRPGNSLVLADLNRKVRRRVSRAVSRRPAAWRRRNRYARDSHAVPQSGHNGPSSLVAVSNSAKSHGRQMRSRPLSMGHVRPLWPRPSAAALRRKPGSSDEPAHLPSHLEPVRLWPPAVSCPTPRRARVRPLVRRQAPATSIGV